MTLKPSEFLSETRTRRPLVHHITNSVTVNDCANICLCAGGSPVMSHAPEEVAEMASKADALVLNIGTLSSDQVESMLIAGKAANKAGVPVLLDPVGAGATRMRSDAAERILAEVKVDVVKGNHGEMAFMDGVSGTVKGVDADGRFGSPALHVAAIARRHGCIAASTGVTDFVSDGVRVMRLDNGTFMEGLVSGTGCMLSSVAGCYIGACGASLESVASAVCAFNVAAEDASLECQGPGTFKMRLFDSLNAIDGARLDRRSKIGWL